jgi:hypothetical protein
MINGDVDRSAFYERCSYGPTHKELCKLPFLKRANDILVHKG